MDTTAVLTIVDHMLMVGNSHVSFQEFVNKANPDSPKAAAELVARVIQVVVCEANSPKEMITEIQTYLEANPSLESFMTKADPGKYGIRQLNRYIARHVAPVLARFGHFEVQPLTEEQKAALQSLHDDAQHTISLAAFQNHGSGGALGFVASDGDLVGVQIAGIEKLTFIKDTDEIKEACRLGDHRLNDRLAIEQTLQVESAHPVHGSLYRLRTRAQCRQRLQASIAQVTDPEITYWNYGEAE